MESNQCDQESKTTVQLRKSTVGELIECKHGNDTYDDVINKLMKFHHITTGANIVE